MLEDKKPTDFLDYQNNEDPETHLIKKWWQKVKTVLFGQKFLVDDPQDENKNFSCSSSDISTLRDWIKAIDVIQPIVISLREELGPNRASDFNLELLGISTYLFHVERLIVKVREHYLTIRYRQEQFSQYSSFNSTEFIQVRKSAISCYNTILNLTKLFQKLPLKKLYSDDLISLIHALELDAGALASAIRALNQYAYRQEAIIQINQLEHNLLQTLAQSRGLKGSGHGQMYPTIDPLKVKLQSVKLTADVDLITDLIEIYQMLKKCYVVARKSVVKETLDAVGENIEDIIAKCSKGVDKSITTNLYQIFSHIESLRFSGNRESRCSKNLSDKAKLARQLLRKVCLKHPIAKEILKQIELPRPTLIVKS